MQHADKRVAGRRGEGGYEGVKVAGCRKMPNVGCFKHFLYISAHIIIVGSETFL